MQQIYKSPLSEFAIASLAFGILCFAPLGLANLGCSVLAVVFGILALKKIAAADSNLRGEGLAAAGIVLGIICVVMGIIASIVLKRNPELLEQILKRSLPR